MQSITVENLTPNGGRSARPGAAHQAGIPCFYFIFIRLPFAGRGELARPARSVVWLSFLRLSTGVHCRRATPPAVLFLFYEVSGADRGKARQIAGMELREPGNTVLT